MYKFNTKHCMVSELKARKQMQKIPSPCSPTNIGNNPHKYWHAAAHMNPLNFWPSAVAATAEPCMCVCAHNYSYFSNFKVFLWKVKRISPKCESSVFSCRSVSLCQRSLQPSKSIGTSRLTNEQKKPGSNHSNEFAYVKAKCWNAFSQLLLRLQKKKKLSPPHLNHEKSAPNRSEKWPVLRPTAE